MIGMTEQINAKTKPAGVASRDFISWSQLSTLRQCPLKYRFRYLEKLEPEFIASSLLVGSSVHSAIEFHHRKQMESGQAATLDEMLEAFWIEWKDRVEESPEVRFGKSEDTASIGHPAEKTRFTLAWRLFGRLLLGWFLSRSRCSLFADRHYRRVAP